ncbi:MAG TPA: hypothetical protein VNA20_10010 [Frankiaceae bacterium]|nr:hypothetical protein [Frankiaceae bacterium]
MPESADETRGLRGEHRQVRGEQHGVRDRQEHRRELQPPPRPRDTRAAGQQREAHADRGEDDEQPQRRPPRQPQHHQGDEQHDGDDGRALQQRDYLAAARQLDGGGRLALSADTMGHLRRVMDDVYTKAKLTGAGRCTTASALTRESAVVRCGARRVVVHVLNTAYYAGVEIDPWHPQYDVYRGPHTHAYTALDL